MGVIERDGARFEFMDTSEGVTLVVEQDGFESVTRGATGLELALREQLRGAVDALRAVEDVLRDGGTRDSIAEIVRGYFEPLHNQVAVAPTSERRRRHERG